jgi:hypothetical protein
LTPPMALPVARRGLLLYREGGQVITLAGVDDREGLCPAPVPARRGEPRGLQVLVQFGVLHLAGEELAGLTDPRDVDHGAAHQSPP